MRHARRGPGQRRLGFQPPLALSFQIVFGETPDMVSGEGFLGRKHDVGVLDVISPQPRRVVVVEPAGVGVDLADVGPALALDILLQVPELAELHDDVQLLCRENSLISVDNSLLIYIQYSNSKRERPGGGNLWTSVPISLMEYLKEVVALVFTNQGYA